MYFRQPPASLGQDVLGLGVITTPGSSLLFATLRRSTGGIPAPQAHPPPEHCADRTAMMPKRRRTRAQNRAHRIATQRRRNRPGMTPHAEYSNTGPAPPHTDKRPTTVLISRTAFPTR
jgi:hypothetical protein